MEDLEGYELEECPSKHHLKFSGKQKNKNKFELFIPCGENKS